MNCAVSVRMGENNEQAILDSTRVYQIVSSEARGVRILRDGQSYYLEIENHSFPIINWDRESDRWPYFLILTSNQALGIRDYSFIFRVKVLPNGCLSGIDINGKTYIAQPLSFVLSGQNLSDEDAYVSSMAPGPIGNIELESLEETLEKIKEEQFYAALTEELSEKIKKIAEEMIAFRKDIQKKIEPNIVGLVIKEFPETSNELEGINETLENSTMKIIDINDEILGICADRLQEFSCLISEAMPGNEVETVGNEKIDQIEKRFELLSGQLSTNFDIASELIKKHFESFEKIRKLSMNMTEPLCFQDLVGQRIQRIVKLVKSMEERVADLVATLGVKLQKYRENPNLSFEQINEEVGKEHALLKGPQREGEGLTQSAVDELLASL